MMDQKSSDNSQAFKSEVRRDMAIDWDVPIVMEDGVQLMCDVFRPVEAGNYPVILSYGPYGKYLLFEDGYKTAWDRMITNHPDVAAGSSNEYQSWEVADPEKWVPEGYVCVRVDSRGCGRSPGFVEVWSPREAQDLYQCIEWAAQQDWSDGNIGMSGVSYYAMNAWQVASLSPPHLKAICTWEGAADMYRELSHHGGILCTFMTNWYDMQVSSVQHGLGSKGWRSAMNGEWVSGPAELTSEELGANREDLGKSARDHEMDDEYWTSRTADFAKITVPILSAANWGGQGLHPRGNFEGFTQSASNDKWLEVHGREHWSEFYTDYGREMQLAFFDHFLKGENNGWQDRRRVQLQVRHKDKFVERFEDAWPIPSTQWTKFYLQADGHGLTEASGEQAATVSYRGFSEGVTFLSAPLEAEAEITGPIAAKLFVSSSTVDADMFLVFRVFDASFREVTFQGALDPHTPIAQGWLRASHRKLDEAQSEPYRPFHSHDEKQPLNPGEPVELDVEIWPTSIVVPAGHRIALSVRGRDYEYPGEADAGLSNMKNKFTGVGPFIHDDPTDRPKEIFDGEVSLHFGTGMQPYLLLPIIPKG
ncbi:MAG: CocE/NonD family hydrolase [Rhodospirillaceae bacterium]|nr:CocE/NonD family hydrolase [Rhodospirillaceae bacterium]MBT6289295.1 CocE/NonD family hydrolase [Rhodospirillaceae bacterium]